MYSFKDDYSEGCHPRILRALQMTNLMQQEGYGDDEYSVQAKDLLRNQMNCPQAQIHFVSGGTQANLIVISSLLKPYESVIAAHTGHINVHEAGAIEATGHKICTIHSENGKLTVAKIAESLAIHEDPPHMVKPKLIYLSNATEVGSVYNKKELQEIYEFCQANDLYLFVDGARIGTAIMAQNNAISLCEMGKYTDVFYIGGTKNGALLGEAIVISNEKLQKDFDYNLKQKGALMAKGRVLGIQFLELFKDGLFFEMATHANTMTSELVTIIREKGFELLLPEESNQIFPIFPNQLAKAVQERYKCYTWQRINEKETAIRMVCSWATQSEAITDFRTFINSF